MEIRILRSADVHALLPMNECIELMHRTMSAVSEGRVVLPLRSILVMPGDIARHRPAGPGLGALRPAEGA